MVMNKPARNRKKSANRGSAALLAATEQLLAAGAFKARCLELMDRVRETGTEYVITKHGRPVAKLVPYVEPARPAFFGAGKGTVLQYDRPFDPIDGTYDVNGDA